MEQTHSQLSDRAVLRRAATDQAQLGILVRRYRSQLYNFVYRFVSDREKFFRRVITHTWFFFIRSATARGASLDNVCTL